LKKITQQWAFWFKTRPLKNIYLTLYNVKFLSFFFGSLKVFGSLIAVSFSNLSLYSQAIFFLSLKYFNPIWASLIVSLNSSSVAPPPSSPLASEGSCQGYGTSGAYITVTPSQYSKFISKRMAPQVDSLRTFSIVLPNLIHKLKKKDLKN